VACKYVSSEPDVGLITGACLAALGNQVTCVDNDVGKIKRLKTGEVIIYEPGLRELVIENMQGISTVRSGPSNCTGRECDWRRRLGKRDGCYPISY
jgi:UDP-glucose 6-dehydrogenase